VYQPPRSRLPDWQRSVVRVGATLAAGMWLLAGLVMVAALVLGLAEIADMLGRWS
jgi:hypothetical protein